MTDKQRARVQSVAKACTANCYPSPLAYAEAEANAEALRACLAAATKPPVVVGLSEEEREVLGEAYSHLLDTNPAMADSLGDINERLGDVEGEYVAVRREDLEVAWKELHDIGQGMPRWCEECARIARLLAPAIAKGGETGGAE